MIVLPGEFSGELPSPTHYPTPCPGQRLAVCFALFCSVLLCFAAFYELSYVDVKQSHRASGVKLYPGSANAHDRRNGVPGVQ